MIYPRVRFFGKTTGNSGYGQACRLIAKSFCRSSIPVQFSSKDSFYKGLSTYSGKADVDFYLQTPPFSKHRTNNYKIGYFYWEADRLPAAWERDITSSLDEIWVPCELTKIACRKAGFRGPIEIVHTPISDSREICEVGIPANDSSGLILSDETFVFYSIFQWNERKGYRKLFRAFLEEFSQKENVVLVVKTNPIKHRDHGLMKIKQDMVVFKRFCKDKHYPDTFVSTDMLSDAQIRGLHSRGDCFVLPHHGEGWGMPIHDAMAYKSLVITTKYGGITDYLNDRNALIINHKNVAVKPMNWNSYYGSSQSWAEPDLEHLKYLMRKAYKMTGKQRTALTERSLRVADSLSIDAFAEKAESILGQSRFERLSGRNKGGVREI